jgi:hypothetical protein
MKRAFLISVRGVNPKTSRAHVEKLEAEGWTVHWPPRDTNQEDDTGFRICSDNASAIREANRVFVIWDGESQGCLFDLGMAFAYRKVITVLVAPAESEGKSFQNMMREWADSWPE